MIDQDKKSRAVAFLKEVIEEQWNEKEKKWITQQQEKLSTNFESRTFYMTFSFASRFVRKSDINLSSQQLAEARDILKGYQPEYWNLLEFVRAYFLLKLPAEDEVSYVSQLTRLYETADVEEQVSLYKALPFYSYPEKIAERCAEGIRTNITDVFDAIALHNPFPANFLDQNAWNQMVLKAVFMKRPLYKIYGADQRANAELARMLVDFAHERWAAARLVSPELWRFVGPFLTKKDILDVQKVISGKTLDRQAGLLACSESNLPELKDLLNQFSEIKKEIEANTLTWDILGKKVESNEVI